MLRLGNALNPRHLRSSDMRSKVAQSFGELFSLPKGASGATRERIEAIVALDRILHELIEPDLEPATTFDPNEA